MALQERRDKQMKLSKRVTFEPSNANRRERKEQAKLKKLEEGQGEGDEELKSEDQIAAA